MSSSWKSKGWKTIHNYNIQISFISSFCLCKQKQHVQDRKKLKLKLSLTKRRTKIINYAHKITEPLPEVKFADADVNGNLKIHLHKQREGKYTFPFNSIDSLHDIFRKFGWPLPNNDVSADEDV